MRQILTGPIQMASMCRCTHIELAQSTIFTPSGISSTTITVDDTLTVGASTPLSTLTVGISALSPLNAEADLHHAQLPATETVRSTIDSISFTAAPTPIATVTSTTVVKATCQKESAVVSRPSCSCHVSLLTLTSCSTDAKDVVYWLSEGSRASCEHQGHYGERFCFLGGGSSTLTSLVLSQGKKAQGGQNVVIIDCGAAGVYEY